jgi:cytochrome b561
MTAHAVASLKILRRSRTWTPFGCLALLTGMVGVLSLEHAVWARRAVEAWVNIHALFGLLLCGLVLVRYQWCVQRSPRLLPTETRELSRHLSRMVYLSLYLVIGARQVISIVNGIRHGGAVDFNLFDEPLRTGTDARMIDTKRDLQLFITAGLSVLMMVRALAFSLQWRSVDSGSGD